MANDEQQSNRSKPTEERQVELRVAYDTNIAASKSPYDGVRICTQGEVLWILHERHWLRDSSRTKNRPNLSRSDLSGIDLRRFNLRGVNLQEASLQNANLQGAKLSGTNFKGANLRHANLSAVSTLWTYFTNKIVLPVGPLVPVIVFYGGLILFINRNTNFNLSFLFQYFVSPLVRLGDGAVILLAASLIYASVIQTQLVRSVNKQRFVNRQRGWVGRSLILLHRHRINFAGADMEGADLRFANLQGADLRNTKLAHADFFSANLVMANLRGAEFADTRFGNANLSQAIIDSVRQLFFMKLDVHTRIDRVLWTDLMTIQIETRLVYAQKIQNLLEMSELLRSTAFDLREKGLYRQSAICRTLAQQMERNAFLREFKIANWFGSWLLDVLAGYGEKPERIFLAYVTVVLGFAFAFWEVTHRLDTRLSQLTWDESIILSLTSFHGRGFFPGSLPLGDWVARVAAGEAVIGLFIELILIATFSRRFLGE